MEGRLLVWRLSTAVRHATRRAAVSRPHDGQRILWMMTPAASTQRGGDHVVITNLIVVKFSGRCARWRRDLYNHENSLQGENNEKVPRGGHHRRLGRVSRTWPGWIF